MYGGCAARYRTDTARISYGYRTDITGPLPLYRSRHRWPCAAQQQWRLLELELRAIRTMPARQNLRRVRFGIWPKSAFSCIWLIMYRTYDNPEKYSIAVPAFSWVHHAQNSDATKPSSNTSGKLNREPCPQSNKKQPSVPSFSAFAVGP